MKADMLTVGFIPLLDVAPLAVAREIGFAEEEGIDLVLRKAPSWSTLRDWLAIGSVDASHMLSPVPVAAALGLGGSVSSFGVLSVLSVNGATIGVSMDLARKMGDFGDFTDAAPVGRALLDASEGRLRFGVPFPFSMHAELLHYWLGALGELPAPQDLDVRTIPPPLMGAALESGEIDAFCVGEPWGSMAVEAGVGALVLPGKAIWAAAPDKVLAARASWIEDHVELAHRLIRAVWRSARWLSQERNLVTATEILSRREYLDVDAEILDRALSGRMVVTPMGDQRYCPGLVKFHGGATGFPWRSQAAWIGRQLAVRLGLDPEWAKETAAQVFRTDIYRDALSVLPADLPGASAKVEGAVVQPTAVASGSGNLILEPDRFFDCRIFDPGLPG